MVVGVLSAGREECGSGGDYGTPIAALEWLVEAEDVYAPPDGACRDPAYLGLPEARSEEGCNATGTPVGGALWPLIPLWGLVRPRRTRRGKT